MTRDTERRDRAVSFLTRRKAIAGGAALLTAGGSLVVVSEPSSAAVSVDQFSVADGEFASEGFAPVVDVTIAYDYDVGMSSVGQLRLTLAVGETTIAEDTLSTDATTLSGDVTLAGSVTDADAWTVEDFSPAVADSVERDLSVTVTFAVGSTSGDTIVSDSATDTATVVVSHPQESKYVASVGGSGTVRRPEE